MSTATLPTRQTASASAALADPFERLMLAPARHVGIELPVVGVSPVPTEPVLLYINRTPWYFTDKVDDLADPNLGGRIPIPEDQHRRLVALHHAPVRCDRVWIGRELPREYREGQEIPRLTAPTETPISRPGVVQAGGRRQAVTVVRRAAQLGAGLLAGVASATRKLDPIVLGGVDRDGLVAWAELARWEI